MQQTRAGPGVANFEIVQKKITKLQARHIKALLVAVIG